MESPLDTLTTRRPEIDDERAPHDTDLIVRIAARDETAFETLYYRYHRRLARFIGRVARDPGLIEEVIHDTLLVVWQGATRYQGRAAVSTWIFGIAYRRSLKALARAAPKTATDDSELMYSDDPGPEDSAVQREQGRYIARALDVLSPEQRAVVELAFYNSCDYRTIAEMLGCPVDTVKTRMFYARKKLKAALPTARELL